METRFLINQSGKKEGAVLSLKQYKFYQKMVDDREMEEDVKAYDKAKAEFAKNPKCYTIEELEKRLEHVISSPD